MEQRWLSVVDIAAYLGVRRDTVYKWISRKHLPAHKVGKFWKFRTAEIDDWVKTGLAMDRSNRSNDDGPKSKDGGA